MSQRRIRRALVAGLAATTSAVIAVAATSANSAAPPVPTASPGAQAEGRAFPAYDALFTDGPEIPYLDTHTPQGMSVWRDWDGAGTDLVILGAYLDGAPSYLIGIDVASGRHIGTVQVEEAHLGAVGLVGEWLFTTGADATTLRRYRTLALREAMAASAASGFPATLDEWGEQQRVVGAHFMYVDAGRIWSGRYSRDPSNSYMAEYSVSPDGRLARVGATLMVPARTQGVLVTDEKFLFYNGLRAGRITVVDRTTGYLDASAHRVIAAPAYGQNLARLDDTVFLLFEGGSIKYANSPGNTAPIRRLQVARYDELVS